MPVTAIEPNMFIQMKIYSFTRNYAGNSRKSNTHTEKNAKEFDKKYIEYKVLLGGIIYFTRKPKLIIKEKEIIKHFTKS